MGKFHGKNGAFEYGSDGVGELTDWSYEETVDMADATVMGASQKEHEPGIPSGSGSFNCLMSIVNAGGAQDAGQAAISIGDEIAVTLYPDGETSTYTKFSGTVKISNISRTADLGSMGKFSVNFVNMLTQGVVS